MTRKVLWWAKLDGGDEAIAHATAYNRTPALQNIWRISNETRLRNDPTLYGAVVSGGVPYAQARRLDIANQAERALRSQQILTDAGIPASKMDPRLTAPAQAAEAARAAKQEADQQKAQQDNGFWNQVGHAFGTVGHAIGTGADAVWNAGKKAVDFLGTGMNAAISPISAPLAAGQADQSQFQKDVHASNPFESFVVGSAVDIGVGISHLFGGVDDQQKADMRAAGYNPDSWTDRYGWYADVNNPHKAVSNQTVAEAKQDHNPYKVDLAREIVASGAIDDFKRVTGLSDDAQRLYDSIRAGKDDEGGQIVQKLAGASFGPGANLAEGLHSNLSTVGVDTNRDSGWYKGVEAVGDLAAYWYVDPLAAAGRGVKLARDARWAVDFTPSAVKDAIINKPAVSKRWDDILDRVDNIHVLGKSTKVEDQAAAAREFDHFRQTYPDMMPYYDTLAGMRAGSIKGSFFKEPTGIDKVRGIEDIKANMIGIERVANPKDYKPIFAMRTAVGEKVTQEARDTARVAIADRIGDAILANQVLAGRPLIKNKMLMPGQIRLTQPLRNATRVFTDKAFGGSGLLTHQLDSAVSKGVIDFNKAADADAALAGVVDSAAGGKFIRDNYTRGGLRSKAAYALSRFGVARDAAILKLDGMDTTNTYYGFVRAFLPRGQSAFLANQWAKADPAARSVMEQNMWEMLANARHSRDTKAADDFWQQQMKGRQTVLDPGETPKEAYSTRASDLVKTPGGDITAAMYSSQFADGVRLPSFLDVVRNTERVGVLSWIAGIANGTLAARAGRILKVGQVGTTSNMLRQALEGRALQGLEDPTGAARVALARMGLAGANAGERAATNETIRQARQLLDKGAMQEIAPLHAKGDFANIATAASRILGDKTSTGLTDLLERGAKVEDIASARSALRLAATKYGGVDWLRKRRAALYDKAGSHIDTSHAYYWMDQVDKSFAEKLQNAAHVVVGGGRAHYMDGGLVDEMDQVDEGLRAGQRLASVKLTNTEGYLGAAGDTGAMRWANALGLREADPVGTLVLQAVARDAVQKLKIGKGDVFPASQLDDLRKAVGEDPVEIAKHLLKNDSRGENYRLNGRRSQYLEGRYVTDPNERNLALDKWAEDMVGDAQHYLGLTGSGIEAGARDAAHNDLVQKIANGEAYTADDLAKISDDFRPAEVHAPIIVGKRFVEPGGSISDKISEAGTKWYNFVVARPLHRIVNEPQVVAAHREVMDALEPLAKELADQGMSHQSIYNLLQTGAYGHAINRVTRYSDNPQVQSYFSALSNNLLWYERAMEDFARRSMQIVKADPAVLAKAHLLTEAGVHSGLIHKQVGTDDDGNPTTDWVFTWPGSGLMMRAVGESLQALGVGDAVKVPVWQDFTSPVKYLSPSLQNPIGFTTTPLIGLSLRALKSIAPSTAPKIDQVLTTLEGGERSFGEQNGWESLMPVYARRFYNALSTDQRDSQFASAYRNALIHYQAAGMLPGADATPRDRQHALDDIATMVQNNLMVRAVFGTFAPSTPGTMGSNVSGIGDDAINAIDRARGVSTIRGEWFQLLEEKSQGNADSAKAYSDAATEWAQRNLGSIIHPEAFTVGTSGQPGDTTGKSFGSSQELTQWMLDNKGFLDQYGDAAYALLPGTTGPYYDQIGYRLQLRNGLRQHKTGQEMYDAMVASQGWKDYNAAKDARDEAIRQGKSQTQAKTWFNDYIAQLSSSNPIWAAAKSAKSNPDYINQNVAPMVAEMAKADNLPPEIAPLQGELQILAKLYDEYHAARAKVAGSSNTDRSARISLAKKYGDRGDQLFKDGPIDGLWSRMKVWEE